MRKQSRPQSLRQSIVIIADGIDEKLYVEHIKRIYPSQSLSKAAIKPELPQKKKVKELFDLAKQRIEEGNSHVILILDLDEALSKQQEYSHFVNFYNRAQAINKRASDKWMNSLTVIVNSPCLEYWHLLHFVKTRKFYHSFAQLLPDLRRHLPDYCKSEVYYTGANHICQKLGGLNGLKRACNNAFPFNLANCRQEGCSEMYKLFDYFDPGLQNLKNALQTT